VEGQTPPAGEGASGEEASGANGDDGAALERALSRAGRRRLAAQATLFDVTNQALLDEVRSLDVETISAEEARELLASLRKRIV
jgi:hypothetical protein